MRARDDGVTVSDARQPGLDDLHICLLLAAAVLLVTALACYQSFARNSIQEFVSGQQRMLESMKAASALADDVTLLEETPGPDSDEVRELRHRRDLERRASDRDILWASMRGRDMGLVRSLAWTVCGGIGLALGLTAFGWFRWKQARRQGAPA